METPNKKSTESALQSSVHIFFYNMTFRVESVLWRRGKRRKNDSAVQVSAILGKVVFEARHVFRDNGTKKILDFLNLLLFGGSLLC